MMPQRLCNLGLFRRSWVIGEALEITIIVSLAVLVIYPSTLMARTTIQDLRKRRIRIKDEDRRRKR